jgi:hypothetical protein
MSSGIVRYVRPLDGAVVAGVDLAAFGGAAFALADGAAAVLPAALAAVAAFFRVVGAGLAGTVKKFVGELGVVCRVGTCFWLGRLTC